MMILSWLQILKFWQDKVRIFESVSCPDFEFGELQYITEGRSRNFVSSPTVNIAIGGHLNIFCFVVESVRYVNG
jgi:hypothetical protein